MASRQIYRHPGHDYRSRASYMITMTKRPEVPDFGLSVRSVFGNNHFSRGAAIAYSSLGKMVKDSLRLLGDLDAAIQLQQYVVMPDHIHILIRVTSPMERALGSHLAAWKVLVNKRGGMIVFEEGFNDQILFRHRSLNDVYRYIRENPYRLLIRKENPEYFRKIENLRIGELRCQMYGNAGLLDNPFKEQVVVHRADSKEKKNQDKDLWLYTASNGGVLVSPFISREEKGIRDAAVEIGGRFILIHDRPFMAREKPNRRWFDLCAEGRGLLIAPMEPIVSKNAEGRIAREGCLLLNSLAEEVVCGRFSLES